MEILCGSRKTEVYIYILRRDLNPRFNIYYILRPGLALSITLTLMNFKMLPKSLASPKRKILIQAIIMDVVIFKLLKKMALDVVLQLDI